MLSNYFDPTARQYSLTLNGLGTTGLASAFVPSAGTIVNAAIRAGCGYYIGGFFGNKVAGAVLAGFLGLPGLFGLALFSKPTTPATPNRRRRHHRRGRWAR